LQLKDIHIESKKPKPVSSTDLGSVLRTAVAHWIEHLHNYENGSGFESRQRYAPQSGLTLVTWGYFALTTLRHLLLSAGLSLDFAIPLIN
jgi:hypothetical protein